MALKQLPVHSDYGNYEFKTELDGVRYGFAFRFNTRLGRWIMDIKSGTGIILLAGIPLFCGVDLLARFRSDDILQGKLFLLNLKDENAECGRNDLGENVLLLYEDAS